MCSVLWYLGTLYTIYKANIFFFQKVSSSLLAIADLNRAVLVDLQRKPSQLFCPPHTDCLTLSWFYIYGMAKLLTAIELSVSNRAGCPSPSVSALAHVSSGSSLALCRAVTEVRAQSVSLHLEVAI